MQGTPTYAFLQRCAKYLANPKFGRTCGKYIHIGHQTKANKTTSLNWSCYSLQSLRIKLCFGCQLAFSCVTFPSEILWASWTRKEIWAPPMSPILNRILNSACRSLFEHTPLVWGACMAKDALLLLHLTNIFDCDRIMYRVSREWPWVLIHCLVLNCSHPQWSFR